MCESNRECATESLKRLGLTHVDMSKMFQFRNSLFLITEELKIKKVYILISN